MNRLSRRGFLVGSSGAAAGTFLASQPAAEETGTQQLEEIEAVAELTRWFGCVSVKTNNGRVTQLEIDRFFGCQSSPEKAKRPFNELLSALTHLESLNLDGSRIATSETLKAVGTLRHLTHLHLHDVEHIRDDDLAHLKPLEHLQSLVLGNSFVTGAGLKHLEDGSLVHLYLSGPVSDEGMKAMGALETLKQLSITPNASSKATATGVAELGNLANLETLFFSDTYRQLQQPSDESIVHLVKCRKLSVLHLKNTALTDKAVPHLLKLKQLRVLHIPPAVSREATRRLIEGLPNATIHSRWTKHGRLLQKDELSG